MREYQVTQKGLEQIISYKNWKVKPKFVEAIEGVYFKEKEDLVKQKLTLLIQFDYVRIIHLN